MGVLKVAKYCINNIAEFSQDSYASHVLRSIFQCLAGFQIATDLLKSKRSQAQSQSNLDLSKIETTESIFDQNDDEIQGIFALICKKVEDVEDSNEIFENIALTRLMEIIIQVSGTSEEKMEKIYNHFWSYFSNWPNLQKTGCKTSSFSGSSDENFEM